MPDNDLTLIFKMFCAICSVFRETIKSTYHSWHSWQRHLSPGLTNGVQFPGPTCCGRELAPVGRSLTSTYCLGLSIPRRSKLTNKTKTKNSSWPFLYPTPPPTPLVEGQKARIWGGVLVPEGAGKGLPVAEGGAQASHRSCSSSWYGHLPPFGLLEDESSWPCARFKHGKRSL